MHESEVLRLLKVRTPCPDGLTGYMICSLASGDDRFRMSRGQEISLRAWRQNGDSEDDSSRRGKREAEEEEDSAVEQIDARIVQSSSYAFESTSHDSVSLEKAALHSLFLELLGPAVHDSGDLDTVPLEAQIRVPELRVVRLYIFNLVDSRDRWRNEFKIVFRIPGQKVGERGRLDMAGAAVFLGGYRSDLSVWVFWDSLKHSEHVEAANIQIQPDTVLSASRGGIAEQRKRTQFGEEVVLACHSDRLTECIQRRLQIDDDSCAGTSSTSHGWRE